MSRLKVYGWIDYEVGRQNRCIMAAKSWAEVARVSGMAMSYLRNYASTTGNDGELAAALASPGVVLRRELDDIHGEYLP